ncbi:adenylate isopentenyltransferase 5, chloroplastic-like [Ipomoea triloba]|uniref:adenylate isopentenyltransferase 5, chloroplastic-like n=1 Tax=Ipomoea triloba TaxID=35885 RepID=UPI00125E4A35|nr:adenylate isopentenyltransferase 5, chloroplastic-like [Ipomoea triloba]
MMSMSCLASKPSPPLVSFPGGINLDPLFIDPRRRKDKVVIVVGATGTGKSKLAIDLARRFPAEIINSDKMQVYKGLDIATNKVTDEERRGVPHHLLGVIDDPDEDFAAADFCVHALRAMELIARKDRVPIIAGGSNSFIKALVLDNLEFRSRYECCFLWTQISLQILQRFVSERVDKMVEAGLVEEVRDFFDLTGGDYSRGIKRSIGVPELDQFFRQENHVDRETRKRLLQAAIQNIKANTGKLARRQLQNILRLQTQLPWNIHNLNATEAFEARGGDESWERRVARPSTVIVNDFLSRSSNNFAVSPPPPPQNGVLTAASVLGTPVAAATR